MRRDASIRINKFREYAADKVDIARKAIYNLAKSFQSTVVEDLLQSFSGVPTSASYPIAITREYCTHCI